MQRRHLLMAAPGLALASAGLHAGQARNTPPGAGEQPLYLEGPVTTLLWAPQPHLELAQIPNATLPADLARRKIPRQKDPVDVGALLQAARVPGAEDRIWRVELPPINRLEAWNVPRPKIDQVVSVLGWRVPAVAGTPTLRAEILFIDGRAYPLRSDPA